MYLTSNIATHPAWNNTASGSSLGAIAKATVASSSTGFPRQVQLALKPVFQCRDRQIRSDCETAR
jgi:hypothetical protein